VPFEERVEELVEHSSAGILVGQLVPAEAVDLVPGEPQATILADHPGISSGIRASSVVGVRPNMNNSPGSSRIAATRFPRSRCDQSPKRGGA
jgi:hypothetical protein